MRWNLLCKPWTGSAIAVLLCAGVCHAAEPTVLMPLLAAAPYGWLDEKGQPQGLYPDIAIALAKVTGLRIRAEVVPFARAATLVANGAADATLMFSNAFTAGKVNEVLTVFYAAQVVQLRPVTLSHKLAPAVAKRLESGMRQLQSNGELQRLFKARLGPAYTLRLTP